MAFIGAALPASSRPRHASTAPRCGTPPPPATVSRRVLLATAATLTASAAAALTAPAPASADRTGKYSTKLTAARRYKPRIAAAVAALAALGPVLNGTAGGSTGGGGGDWRDAARTYVAGADGGLSAAKLFGSAYFAEGNRISATEKALADEVAAVEAAVSRLGAAATAGSRPDAVAAWRAAARAFNTYLQVAKLDETPQIELEEE